MGTKKKRLNRKMTEHHVTPSSRGGLDTLENIAMVRGSEHEHYHTLFANRTPEEIVGYLVHTFWKDDWRYVDRAYERFRRGRYG